MRRLTSFVVAGCLLYGPASLLYADGLESAAPDQALCGAIERSLHRACRMAPVQLKGTQLYTERLEISNDPDFSSGTTVTGEGVTLALDWSTFLTMVGGSNLGADTSHGEVTVRSLTSAAYNTKAFQLTWDLQGLSQGVEHLSGTASATQGATTVRLTQFAALKDGRRLEAYGMKGISRLDFDKATAQATVKEGIAALTRLAAQGPDATLRSEGTFDLIRKTLDVTAHVHRPGVAGRGELDANLAITGLWTHPETSVRSLKQKNFRATLHTTPH